MCTCASHTGEKPQRESRTVVGIRDRSTTLRAQGGTNCGISNKQRHSQRAKGVMGGSNVSQLRRKCACIALALLALSRSVELRHYSQTHSTTRKTLDHKPSHRSICMLSGEQRAPGAANPTKIDEERRNARARGGGPGWEGDCPVKIVSKPQTPGRRACTTNTPMTRGHRVRARHEQRQGAAKGQTTGAKIHYRWPLCVKTKAVHMHNV